MPQELPGFYYDPEKNRYFPIKGPIPGSSRNASSSSSSSSSNIQKSNQTNKELTICRRKGIQTSKLLQVRELHGKELTFNKWKCNFQQEYQKAQASQPMVWRYQSTEWIADGALEQVCVDMQTLEGQNETNVLLMGSMNGSFSIYEVGKVGQHFDYGVKCMPDRVWPCISENQADFSKVPGDIWRPTGASTLMPSNISCIKRTRKPSLHTNDDGSTIQHALITTLGSETSGGSISILNLREPMDFSQSIPILRRRIFDVASLNCTIWTADCNLNGTQAVVGTNLGAVLVNLETGVLSWVCRSKSDVFSQQFDQSGNVVLCGLRNGAIITVDVRQKQGGFSARLPRQQIPYPSHKICEPSRLNVKNLTKQWFEVRGNIYPSYTVNMPLSISSLVSLQSYDQYFLASSMDGSIKLYDHRMVQRGAVQSYEGHVNSHTRTQLGVDPSESLVMSGGEDGYVCIWSIRTGELLSGTKISNSVPSTVCWAGTREMQGLPGESQNYEEIQYAQDHSWGAWLGSREGLFFIHGT